MQVYTRKPSIKTTPAQPITFVTFVCTMNKTLLTKHRFLYRYKVCVQLKNNNRDFWVRCIILLKLCVGRVSSYIPICKFTTIIYNTIGTRGYRPDNEIIVQFVVLVLEKKSISRCGSRKYYSNMKLYRKWH